MTMCGDRDVELERIGRFLVSYSSGVLSCGATTLRTEKNVMRMARRFGVDTQLTILPMHCVLSVRDGADGSDRVLLSGQYSVGVNFQSITALSRLSWKVADEGLSIGQACRMLRFIMSRQRHPRWLVTMMAGVANASFCRLFGGDACAMAFVFLGTVLGMEIKGCLLRNSADGRIATIIAGMVSAIVASGCALFALGTTPDVAVAASVLYLVPGVLYINAFSDFIHGHYICSATMLMHAIEMTVSLGVGLLCGTMLLAIT